MRTTNPWINRVLPWGLCAIGVLAVVVTLALNSAGRSGASPIATDGRGEPLARPWTTQRVVPTQDTSKKLTPAEATAAALERDWGIKAIGIHRSMAGAILDFRYVVLDPEKASDMAYQEDVSYLINEATGVRIDVPATPKTGSLRETAVNLEPGRQYSVLIPNREGYLKAGDRVTIAIGDFRASNLTID